MSFNEVKTGIPAFRYPYPASKKGYLNFQVAFCLFGQTLGD